MVEPNAGFEDVFRAKTDDEPALRLQDIRHGQCGKSLLPTGERSFIEVMHFGALGRVNRSVENRPFFFRIAALAGGVLAQVALQEQSSVLAATVATILQGDNGGTH